MGDDALNDVVKKVEQAALEKGQGLLKRWGVPPKVIAAIMAVVLAVVGGITTAKLAAQGNREEYAATVDEVRDAERVRAAMNQLDEQYKGARSQLTAQGQALATRASVRLRRDGLSYDFDKSVWFVPDGVAQPHSGTTAAVTSK